MAELDPKQLRPEGWQRRSIASEPRLSEMVEMYRDLGYEVILVPAARDEGDGASCTACFSGSDGPGGEQVIYTRPRPVRADHGEGSAE